MKSNYLLTVALVVVVLTIPSYLLIKASTSSRPTINQNTLPNLETEIFELPEESITKSQGGIEVSITQVERTTDNTTVQLTMSNHRYNLSDPNILETVLLAGITPDSYQLLSSEMGGHHVEAELIFSGTQNGDLVISPTTDILFTFQNI